MQACTTQRSRRQCGFTMLELMIVVAVIGLMSAFAIPTYNGYIDRARVGKAVQDIGRITLEVQKFQTNNDGAMPDSLEQIGMGDLRDPWGKRYIYLAMTEGMRKGPKRRGLNNQPLNTDFDVVSRGADGRSNKKMTDSRAKDDVVRAYNGSFIGLGEDITT